MRGEKSVGRVHVAKWYEVILFPDWLRSLMQKPERFLAPLVEPGMTAADIGCGMGFGTLALARLVGPDGTVFAVDLQQQMLTWAARKAQKAGLASRIEFQQCSQDDVTLSEPVDLVLTMWMVHEVPDRPRFLQQVRSILNPGGKYLLVEPKFHIGRELFETICTEAEQTGLKKTAEPMVGLSYAALFENPL